MRAEEELQELKDRIGDLEDELAAAVGERNDAELECEGLEAELESPTRDFCRRCFSFTNVARDGYCSRDCREFGVQASFDVLYKQLHPEWPEVRGTPSTLLA